MIGKGHELHSQAEFERDWSIKLMKDIYDGFLSESEIQRMLNGADLWMGADDVMERLNKRQKHMQKKNKSKIN